MTGIAPTPICIRNAAVERPDQVWSTDITYVPMAQGHAYLCAVMDWHSRKVLGWAVSNTMGTELCLEALEKALQGTGRVPEIFNTDQGSQFTSAEWINRLTELEIKISMDGRRRWLDNVFIERLWRSLKYEDIYLKEYANVLEPQKGLARWFAQYNDWHPHCHLAQQIPTRVYDQSSVLPQAACPPPAAMKFGSIHYGPNTSLRSCFQISGFPQAMLDQQSTLFY